VTSIKCEHFAKQELEIISSELGNKIDTSPDEAKADSLSIRRTEPISKWTVASKSQFVKQDWPRLGTPRGIVISIRGLPAKAASSMQISFESGPKVT
jgi:hypothetical protein